MVERAELGAGVVVLVSLPYLTLAIIGDRLDWIWGGIWGSVVYLPCLCGVCGMVCGVHIPELEPCEG